MCDYKNVQVSMCEGSGGGGGSIHMDLGVTVVSQLGRIRILKLSGERTGKRWGVTAIIPSIYFPLP